MPRGDRTLKDSQRSVVNHERAPSQELEKDRYPHCTGGDDLEGGPRPWPTATSVCVLAKPAVSSGVTAADGLFRSPSVFYPVCDHIPPACSLACVCWAVSVLLLCREGPLQDQDEHRV